MTYDYKAQTAQSMPRTANPYAIENMFLFISGVVFVLVALMSAFQAKIYLSAGQHLWASLCIALAACLTWAGVQWLTQCFSQLRFWLGQNHPVNLPDAQQLSEQLRHQVVSFAEPQGPLNGLLYSMMDRLHLAPQALQNVVQHRFATLVNALVLLCSVTYSSVMFSGHPHDGLMSLIYLVLGGLILLDVLEFRAVRNMAHSGDTIMRGVWLAVLSVLTPVLVPLVFSGLPAIHWPILWMPTFVVVAGTVLNAGLFMWAASVQKDVTEQTAVACETHTLDMQCPASQVWIEVEREFQRQWVNDVPNRRYLNQRPDADKKQGSQFSGHILEESQPQWVHEALVTRWGDALGQERGRLLIAMGLCGVLSALVCAVLSIHWLNSLGAASMQTHVADAAVALALLVQSRAALKGGHFLWSRLYFLSRVTWVELQGTQQQAELEVGNNLHGHVRSRSKVTRVQNATLRVWSADIQSVTYGKDGQRCVVSMSPARDTANKMVLQLMAFAQNQSLLIAPDAPSDQQRILELAKLNQKLQQSLTLPNTLQLS